MARLNPHKMAAAAILLMLDYAHGQVLVNEVAWKGLGDQCNGEDWIELYNNGSLQVDLLNFVLHDDKGPLDDEAKTFSETLLLGAGEYTVMCKDVDFLFGIGGSDTITLLDSSGVTVSTSGTLAGTGADADAWALFEDGYTYTTTRTPGTANVFTTPEETFEDRMARQNHQSKDFFKMDDDGTSFFEEINFGEVVDMSITLDPSDKVYLENKPSHEQYVPVSEFKVVWEGGVHVLPFGGRMRTKGQSTLYIPVCLGLRNTPFLLDFGPNQTLFGVEKGYLRNHMSDSSYMREYALHRLNARMGLPHLRTRSVRLLLNGEYIGLYSFMEAPDQAYVMQRSFGSFNPATTGLFKFKSFAAGCRDNPPDEDLYKDSPTPDPYYFERGEHRADIPVLYNVEQCVAGFWGEIMKGHADSVKAWLAFDENCSDAMVQVGLVDRDFGPKDLEARVIDFLEGAVYLEGGKQYHESNLANKVDVDQWLKTFAVQAVTLNFDSPLGNKNNWYIATTNSGAGDWKIFQYDLNNVATRSGAHLCGPECTLRQIYWPIMRPSCKDSVENVLVGPLLAWEDSSASNRDKYVSFVQAVVDILDDAFMQELRDHGELIKDFVALDPLSPYMHKPELYVTKELAGAVEDFHEPTSPFLKILEARLEQVRLQLDARSRGTLPRNAPLWDESDEYESTAEEFNIGERCPDWRDTNKSDYMLPETYVNTPDHKKCDDHRYCKGAGACFSKPICRDDGQIYDPDPDSDCEDAYECQGCFPFSACGFLKEPEKDFRETSECNATGISELCKDASFCFSHRNGACAYDGELLGSECRQAETCKACFPKSRCSSTKLPGEEKEEEEEEEEEDEELNSSNTVSTGLTGVLVVLYVLCTSG